MDDCSFFSFIYYHVIILRPGTYDLLLAIFHVQRLAIETSQKAKYKGSPISSDQRITGELTTIDFQTQIKKETDLVFLSKRK